MLLMRRVVTGQTSDERHIYTHVEEVAPLEMGGGAKWYPMWGWEQMPTLPFCPEGPYQPNSVFPRPGGMRINTVTFPPGFGAKGVLPPIPPDPEYKKLASAVVSGGEHDYDTGMHSTDSIDLGLVLSGEMTLIQGDGSEQTLKRGDVLIQNGAMHAWKNRGSEPCIICFVVLGTPRAKS